MVIDVFVSVGGAVGPIGLIFNDYKLKTCIHVCINFMTFKACLVC